MPTVMWFRRDLRLLDNAALTAAASSSASSSTEVVALFVLDPRLWEPAGPVRRAYLLRTLRALDRVVDGRLVVRRGDPAVEVGALARAVGAEQVHVAQDFAPYGRRRDDAVQMALGATGVELVRTGSPYAVAPGRVLKEDGSAYAVFTPYHRAWLAHGWRRPAELPAVHWADVDRPPVDDALPPEPADLPAGLPAAGEQAALAAWQRYRAEHLGDYDTERNRPDLDSTSRLSVHLKYGEIHPRTLLADLGLLRGKAVDAFRRQLAWREFFADVLWHQPHTARESPRADMAGLVHDVGAVADERFRAWQEGRTGYPFVDAGMRQLRSEGWMHNRVRLTVASFLTKDLHQDWRRGARHFMDRLVDGDLASNNQSWQWVAGSGVDAAPYYRVFNPVLQGQRFDPDGEYVRRWVPELRAIGGAAVHEPWDLRSGVPAGYPDRIVDHAVERAEALRRYAAR